MQRVAVIDYGMGNLHSVAKALETVAQRGTEKFEVLVTGDAAMIESADRVVLPGVGAMRDCMGEMRRLGIDTVVHHVVKSGVPLLGVCVGMQAMLEYSAENNGVDCLHVFPGKVQFFGDSFKEQHIKTHLKIPHMGWNQVHQVLDHPMWQGIAQDTRFYFVHSYYAEPELPDVIAGTCVYGFSFTAAIAKDNVFATQFHPEKSAQAGLQVYANFLQWNGKQ